MSKSITMLMLVVCQVFGDVWLSRGMRQIGEVNSLELMALLAIAIKILFNPWIWLGIAFLVLSLTLYLAALSRFDLSYVMPIAAFTYVLSALMSVVILREHVSIIRLLGTCIITAGAFVVGWDERRHNS